MNRAQHFLSHMTGFADSVKQTKAFTETVATAYPNVIVTIEERRGPEERRNGGDRRSKQGCVAGGQD